MPLILGIASGIGFIPTEAGQPAPPPPPALTDATFQTAVNDALALDPVSASLPIPVYGSMSNWNTSQVTNMKDAFLNRTTFNGNITNWDVSNVTNMQGMFYGA